MGNIAVEPVHLVSTDALPVDGWRRNTTPRTITRSIDNILAILISVLVFLFSKGDGAGVSLGQNLQAFYRWIAGFYDTDETFHRADGHLFLVIDCICQDSDYTES